MSLVFLLVLLYSCTFSSSSAASDDAALLKIKEQLGNPDILNNWVKGVKFCVGSANVGDHVRIECTLGRISGFYIYNVTAKGTSFPQAICNLTKLKYFSMELIFGMYGPLPSCINNLVHLEYFTMRNNPDFSTPVPGFLNNKNLANIVLSKSGVNGPIPPSLATSSLGKLLSLDLSENGVSGTIPWELAQRPPPNLLLNDNLLTGDLPRNATWRNLGFITLGHNRLNGDVSSLFGKKKTVTYIDLSYNQLAFDISNLEAPKHLDHLDLSYNQIYGKLPKSLANKPDLTLYLEFNRPCAEKKQKPHVCLCGDPRSNWPLPPCPVLAPPPAP